MTSHYCVSLYFHQPNDTNHSEIYVRLLRFASPPYRMDLCSTLAVRVVLGLSTSNRQKRVKMELADIRREYTTATLACISHGIHLSVRFTLRVWLKS
jgi:hypothetical protein